MKDNNFVLPIQSFLCKMLFFIFYLIFAYLKKGKVSRMDQIGFALQCTALHIGGKPN
jgi:hypothetical protein